MGNLWGNASSICKLQFTQTNRLWGLFSSINRGFCGSLLFLLTYISLIFLLSRASLHIFQRTSLKLSQLVKEILCWLIASYLASWLLVIWAGPKTPPTDNSKHLSQQGRKNWFMLLTVKKTHVAFRFCGCLVGSYYCPHLLHSHMNRLCRRCNPPAWHYLTCVILNKSIAWSEVLDLGLSWNMDSTGCHLSAQAMEMMSHTTQIWAVSTDLLSLLCMPVKYTWGRLNFKHLSNLFYRHTWHLDS